VTDEELIAEVTDAIVALVGVRRVLEARVAGVCLHPNAVKIGTFEHPDAVLCPDCGSGYE
jgi:hypothetical protein